MRMLRFIVPLLVLAAFAAGPPALAGTQKTATRVPTSGGAHNSAGTVSTSSAIVAPKVPVSSIDMGASGYRRLVPSAFRPTSTITARTPARFATDLANLKAGERLNVMPMTIPGEYFIRKKLRSYAEIHFATGAVFSGATDFRYYTVQISNSSNIRIYGGQVMNPTRGPCVRVDDSTNIVWWHFKIHDCSSTGLFAESINRWSTGLDFDGEIYHVAYDPTHFDPHAEKCTGIHGAYLGGVYTNDTVATSGKFSLYVHGAECGAAVQAGSNLVNTQLWVKAVDISYQARYQTAGNAIQFWGGGLRNIAVRDVVGADLAGRLIETGGLYSCCNSGIVVYYEHGTNTLRNRRLRRLAESNPAVTFVSSHDRRDR